MGWDGMAWPRPKNIQEILVYFLRCFWEFSARLQPRALAAWDGLWTLLSAVRAIAQPPIVGWSGWLCRWELSEINEHANAIHVFLVMTAEERVVDMEKEKNGVVGSRLGRTDPEWREPTTGTPTPRWLSLLITRAF
jgi:hypothetical protein